MPHLKPGSAIIGTASEQAYDPSPDLYDYAQTKAATMNYVKSLAKQLGPKGIRVNAVAPGPIWTPLQVSGGATMEKLEKFGGQTPLGRPGQPAELALDLRPAWRPPMPALLPARSTALPADLGNPDLRSATFISATSSGCCQCRDRRFLGWTRLQRASHRPPHPVWLSHSIAHPGRR